MAAPTANALTISIITPVLNRRAMIGDALRSVHAQGIDGCEHLVIDGGSIDGTQNAVATVPGARLIEAAGASIYEAINRGITEAGGRIVGLLNSDDQLASGALQRVLAAFEAFPDADIVHGRAALLSRCDSGSAETLRGTATPGHLRSTLLGVPAINASFMARGLFDRLGLFDTELRIAADREWLARAALAGVSVTQIDQVLYVYRAHAGSLTIGGERSAELDWVREHLAIARQYLADRAVDSEARRSFAAFHGKSVVQEALLHLRAGNLKALAAGLRGAFTTWPAWPLDALSPLFWAVKNRLRAA